MKIITYLAVCIMTLIPLSRAEEKLPFSAETALSKMDLEIERAKATAVTALKKSLEEETKKRESPDGSRDSE